MYDWPAQAPAFDRLWSRIRDRLRTGGNEAPDALDRTIPPMDGWVSPDLLLGQTCGLPLRTFLRDRVTLVGTFDFDLPDAPPGHYYSHLLARSTDHRPLAQLASRLAISQPESQSGWAAAWETLTERGIFADPVVQSGAHRASAEAVADGSADLAAIDAVTWRLLAADLPDLAAALRIVDTTRPTPGLPLITAKGRDPVPLRDAIAMSLAEIDAKDRRTLGITRLVVLPLSSYLAIPIPPDPVTIRAR